ncbi:unnamed protein product [Orchesella dallaii]|uniref:Peptidase M14 domain-containing protein n=1 Tax=Orchesella dallaii TaxID=48710 RepID=A0ABP1QGT8_9HEXA
MRENRSLGKVGFLIPTCLLLQVLLVLGNPTVSQNSSEEEKKSYRNYKVLRTQPVDNKDVLDKLMTFAGVEDISFWKYPVMNGSADIMASPDKVAYVEEAFKDMGIEHMTVINDVEELFQGQNPDVDDEYTLKQNGGMSWSRYHRYNEIISYAKQQAARDGMVSYQSIGTSTEGREIGLVKISDGTGGNKPAIWMDGGIHAREWISPATVTYIMHKLITDINYRDLVQNFDWYIVPIINVDGYEYTHTRDRLWRKTRRPNQGTHCVGTDPNRNWGFKWGGPGSSGNPCEQTYRGPKPFSEPETSAVANAVLARRNQIKMYLTFHSYSQLWLLPWSYTRQRPSDYSELQRLGLIGARALASTYGTRYRVGSAPEILYEAAGGSDDWAKGAAGIKYSYTLELRDTGTYGFALPARQITATGEETLRGVAATARALHKTLNTASG